MAGLESLIEDVAFKIFALLDAAELARIEITCAGWLGLLRDREDLWLNCLDSYFSVGRKRRPSVHGKRSREMCARRFALPSRSLSCGDSGVAIYACSAKLCRPLGRHRSVWGSRAMSSTLPMCWPRGDDGYDLAYYAFFEVEVGIAPPMTFRQGIARPVVTVGLASSKFSADSMLPGCDKNSIAMDGTNGLILFNNAVVDIGVEFGPGDVVGCGIANCDDNDHVGVFFVKNGDLVQPRGYAIFKTLRKDEVMYPVVGLDSHSPIKMHFDNFPSTFDVFKLHPEIKSCRSRQHSPDAHLSKMNVTTSWSMPSTAFQRDHRRGSVCSMGG